MKKEGGATMEGVPAYPIFMALASVTSFLWARTEKNFRRYLEHELNVPGPRTITVESEETARRVSPLGKRAAGIMARISAERLEISVGARAAPRRRSAPQTVGLTVPSLIAEHQLNQRLSARSADVIMIVSAIFAALSIVLVLS